MGLDIWHVRAPAWSGRSTPMNTAVATPRPGARVERAGT